MQALTKKLGRDLRHMIGQVIAMSLVVACGVASFVSMRSTYLSLQTSQDAYYSTYRFADVFASLKRAPESVAAVIGRVPGVATVQTSVVAQVSLDLPGVDEPAQATMVSIPPRRNQILNDLHLVKGTYIGSSGSEILISEAFALANGFEPGDQISVNINGRKRKFTIVGVALSPEYIYEIRPGDIFPDNRRYGIIWIGRQEIASAYQMDGAFNQVSLTLAPSADEGSVLEQVDDILIEYGGLGSYGRTEQHSYRFISNEFSQLRAFGIFLPAVFLGVTAFLLHLVLSRLIKTEREQIGLLKAFGFSSRRIAVHYLLFACCAIALGVIAGIAAGAWLGFQMTRLYAEYFHFPLLNFSVGPGIILASFILSFGAAAIGAFSSLLIVMRLPPAEAMRPEAPATYEPGIIERLGIHDALSAVYRSILRSLVRRPGQALLAALGIAFATALLFTGFYFFDAIERVIDVQFKKAIREDLILTFNSPLPGRARHEVEALRGVNNAEFFRVASARLRHGHLTKRVGLMGVEATAELHRIVDKSGTIHPPPSEGIMLSSELASRLGVTEGDTLTVEVLEGSRPVEQLVVSKTIDEMIGVNAYMDIESLNRLLREDDSVSGAYLSIAREDLDRLYPRLKSMPAIAGVSLPAMILKGFEDTFARTIGAFTFFLVLFAGAIVFGVVYNAARIALSERGRELASLRVLGFTSRETARMLSGEQLLITLAAIPFGFVIGIVLCYSMNNLVDRELMRLFLVFSLRTPLLTAVIVIAATIISNAIVSRRIKELDLVEVLKTRE